MPCKKAVETIIRKDGPMAALAANQPHRVGESTGWVGGPCFCCTRPSLSAVIGTKGWRNEDNMWARSYDCGLAEEAVGRHGEGLFSLGTSH